MKTIEFWLPIIISLAVTPFALLMAIASMGAGHGDYLLAKILFPYTMLSVVAFRSITAPFILLAILQFPIYGLILTFAGKRKKLGLSAIVLGIVHILTVGLCLIFIGSNFS